MAVIFKNTEKCRILQGNNDISSVRSLDIRMRHDEVVTATIELIPEEVFIEIDSLITVINGIKYHLIRDEEMLNGCRQAR